MCLKIKRNLANTHTLFFSLWMCVSAVRRHRRTEDDLSLFIESASVVSVREKALLTMQMNIFLKICRNVAQCLIVVRG